MAKKKRVNGSPEAQLTDLRNYIQKLLKKEGMYQPEMTYQVEITASTIQIFKKIRDEILVKNAPPVIEEKSREGDKRKKENPIYTMYRGFADLSMRSLRALNMNKELTKGREDKEEQGAEDSPLAMLMKDLDKDEEE